MGIKKILIFVTEGESEIDLRYIFLYFLVAKNSEVLFLIGI